MVGTQTIQVNDRVLVTLPNNKQTVGIIKGIQPCIQNDDYTVVMLNGSFGGDVVDKKDLVFVNNPNYKWKATLSIFTV